MYVDKPVFWSHDNVPHRQDVIYESSKSQFNLEAPGTIMNMSD